ncbi:hypothetical protein BDN70DRAFT_662439 [Pholiota conissans]|uniref:Desiccation-related protein PCC13-62 n=1 Tax=Pholiota conissans TaxID=109636 RepID=A0A9P5Z1X8_9AGAR|nr:hypothetical protein BDN70DRAFT_662439 [Pholiota conissans]
MRPTTLTSLVTIALASTAVFSNVIPFGDLHTHGRRISAVVKNLNANLGLPTFLSNTPSVKSRNQPDVRRSIDFRQLPTVNLPGLGAIPRQLVERGEYQNDYNNNEGNRRDIQFLNLALLLEELLVAFFERGLSRYTQEAFVNAGYPVWVRGRYVQILEHERIHRDFIRSAIVSAGGEYVRPCQYNFYDNDIHAFVDLSEALETIAASAYTGALQYFNNRAYVTTGASILAVEARHASWINSAVRKQNPWNTAFETPLTPSQVATLLSNFFDYASCPAGNNNLLPPEHRPHPRLLLSPRLVPGEKAEISFPSTNLERGQRFYVSFLSGIETIFVPLEMRSEKEGVHGQDGHDGRDGRDGSNNNDHNNNGNNNNYRDEGNNDNRNRYFVEIPRDLAGRGTVFVLVVRGPENIREVNLDDNNVVAGPAIVMFPFDHENKSLSW